MNHKRNLKRTLSGIALAGILGVTATFTAFPPLAASAAAWERVDGVYQMSDGTPIENVVARGIDVSHWKQSIDWNAVAADDVQFVMLGTRYAGDVDPYFRINAENASKAGLKVGAYIYSYATTPQMAVEEADFVLDLIKDYPISFPVAFDVEASVQSTLTPAQLAEITNTFCERIEAAGYHPMVYANDHWLANKIDMSQVDYDVWVARYGTKHAYEGPVMWQATSTGSVNGVEGNVDIDFLYQDLSSKLPPNLWRTIAGKTYYYQDYVMQKDGWIHDGSGWYYMNSAGLAQTGWMDLNDRRYYLRETDGQMTTGWKAFGPDWYYFADHGGMTTGWQPVGDAWYYMEPDGKMKTGWLDQSGKKYYLKADGSMANGWTQLDQTWYYFYPAGEMASGWINLGDSWYLMGSDGGMQTGWQMDQGSWYYLSMNSGKMTVGWREVNGSWYYFNGSGAMVTGMNQINGLYYYFLEDGRMAANTVITLDGLNYQINGDGVCSLIETTDPNGAGSTGTPDGGNSAGGSDSAGSENGSGGSSEGGSSSGGSGSVGDGSGSNGSGSFEGGSGSGGSGSGEGGSSSGGSGNVNSGTDSVDEPGGGSAAAPGQNQGPIGPGIGL